MGFKFKDFLTGTALTGGLGGLVNGFFGDDIRDGIQNIGDSLRPKPVSGTGFGSLPQEQQDLLRSLFSSGQGLLGQGPTQQQNQAFSQLGDTTGILGQTAQGEFLNNNPYLDQTFDRAANAVTRRFNDVVVPGLDAKFAGSGRFGSPALNRAQSQARTDLGDSLGGLANSIYGGNYQLERGRQQQAAGILPSLGLNQFNAASSLANQPFAQLQQIGSISGINPVNQQQQFQNQGAGMLGGALSGAQLGSAFGLPGIIGGGLLGGFLGSR